MGETDEVIVWETGQRNGEQPGVAVANALGKAERSSDTESDAGSSGERAAESESDAGLSGERVVWVESEAVKEMVSVAESAAAGEEVGEKGNVAGLTPETSVENLGDVSDTASDTVSAAAMARTSLQIPGEVTGGVNAEERVATEKSVGMMAVAPRRPG